jgi:hypothetical protein
MTVVQQGEGNLLNQNRRKYRSPDAADLSYDFDFKFHVNLLFKNGIRLKHISIKYAAVRTIKSVCYSIRFVCRLIAALSDYYI